MSGNHCSEVTPIKQKTVSMVTKEVMRVDSLIYEDEKRRWNGWKNAIQYWDLCAGEGLDREGRKGSPLMFMHMIKHHNDAADQAKYLSEMKFVCRFIDKRKKTCSILQENLNNFILGSNGLYTKDQFDATVLHGRFEDFIETRIQEELELGPKQPYRYGILYLDPNGEISLEALKLFSELFRLFDGSRYYFLDVLINIDANIIKRIRGQAEAGHKGFIKKVMYLSQILESCHKKYWGARLIYGEKAKWTLLFGSNYHKFNEFENVEIFDIKRTPIGEAIYYSALYNNREIKERGLGNFIAKQGLGYEKEDLNKSLKYYEDEEVS